MIVKHSEGYQHCERCRGAGKILGLGNFKIKCDPCLGVGWIKQITEKDEDEILNKKSETEKDADYKEMLGKMPKHKGSDAEEFFESEGVDMKSPPKKRRYKSSKKLAGY